MVSQSGLIGISWPWNVFPRWIENEYVISDAIKNVILTSVGERKMNMGYGSDTMSLVFENKGTLLNALARREIMMAISNNIPYMKVLNIDVTDGGSDTDPVTIDVEWEYLGVKGTTEIEAQKA